jgi:polyisoprenoid-binding protein YceI
MSRSARIIVGLIVLVLIVVFAVLAYIWVSGGSSAPSVALSAPTLAIVTRAPSATATRSPATPTNDATAEAAATQDAATDDATDAVTPRVAAPTAAPASIVVFNIVPESSEVRFITHEVLRGSPNTVTGRTNQVAGQIGVDFDTPANSQIGEIKIDARSLSTDNELRNRAIRGQILQSSQDEFEFITFKPTGITGLPDTVRPGNDFTFNITGDLTIRDITKPVTFEVVVTPNSKTQITGSANATVQRSDYDLTIPNVPGVADVDQAVRLEIDFIATVGDATPAP